MALAEVVWTVCDLDVEHGPLRMVPYSVRRILAVRIHRQARESHSGGVLAVSLGMFGVHCLGSARGSADPSGTTPRDAIVACDQRHASLPQL